MIKEIDLKNMVNAKYTYQDMADEFNVSKGTIGYWLKKYNLRLGRKHRRTWTDKQLISICKSNYTMTDVARGLGLRCAGGSNELIKRHIERLRIDISHFDRSKGKMKHTFNKPLSEVMVRGSSYARKLLKTRLIRDHVIQYKCSKCGCEDEWNGKEIVLILDHINGINNDHRKENLRFVCPNCNSQLPTFAGRNVRRKKVKKNNYCVDCGTEILKTSTRCNLCAGIRRRIDWPEIKELIRMLDELGGNYSALGRSLGVSDNAVRKHIKSVAY